MFSGLAKLDKNPVPYIKKTCKNKGYRIEGSSQGNAGYKLLDRQIQVIIKPVILGILQL